MFNMLMAQSYDPNAVKPQQVQQAQFDGQFWEQAQQGVRNAIEMMPRVESDRPELAANPFDNPFVLLGMAAQGRAAQGLQMGAQIDMQNQQRVDAWQASQLQAENYRQLRKSNLQEKLATLEAQEAQARQRKIESDASSRIAQGQLDDAQRRTAIAEARFQAEQDARAEREARSANWTTAVKDIPALAQAAQGVASTIEAYLRGWVNVPGVGPVSTADPDEQRRSLANAVARSNIAGQLALMRAYGFNDEATNFEKQLETMIEEGAKFDAANLPGGGPGAVGGDAQAIGNLRSAIPGFDPATQQPQPGNLQQAQVAYQYQQGLENQTPGPQPGTDPFADHGLFESMFQTVEDQATRDAMTQQISTEGGLSAGRDIQLRISNYKTVIQNGLQEDMGFLRDPRGREALWQGVEAVLDNVAGNENEFFNEGQSRNYGGFRDEAARHAAQVLGIDKAHILNNKQAMTMIRQRWHKAKGMKFQDNPLMRTPRM